MTPSSQDLARLGEAARQAPDQIDRWLDLCAAAEQLKNYAEVLRSGDEIVRLAPNQPQPHFIRGLALQNLDRIEEAIEAYRRVIALHPDYVDAWINLGECYGYLNRSGEAEQACRRAIEASGQTIPGDGTREVAESEYGNHHWNLALVELLKGDYANGFKRYPARFKAIAGRERPNFTQPLWHGEDLNGKTILVVVDQGHGDTLLMARYLPLLRAKGARVILQAQAPLVAYLKGWDGIDDIVEQGATPPAFDYHASEFDLPRYFGTTVQTIPANVPYLPLPPPDAVTQLPKGKFKAGLTWAGNADHRNDKRRSIPFEVFEPLFAQAGIEFYAINRDLRPGDAERLARLPVTDLSPRLRDFSDTAKFINQMDLVISCDTSIAHLAGGMGKPLWVLLPYAPSWCWMRDREDSPWYPTARIFRQKSRGDWRSMIDEVLAALPKFTYSPASR